MSAKELLNDITVRITDLMDVCAVDARATVPGMRQGILIILENIDPDDYAEDPRGALGKADFDKRAAALKLAREHVEKAKTGQYERNTGRKDQITEELRVAQYLLGGDA